jgi:hypothetical protein
LAGLPILTLLKRTQNGGFLPAKGNVCVVVLGGKISYSSADTAAEFGVQNPQVQFTKTNGIALS